MIISFNFEFLNYSTFTIQVTAGSKYIGGRQTRNLAFDHFYQHPNYTLDPDINDIALGKLDRPFEEEIDNDNYLINPICLPTKSRTLNEDFDYGTGFGFGQIKQNPATILQKGTFRLNPCRFCRQCQQICTKFDKRNDTRGCQVNKNIILQMQLYTQLNFNRVIQALV